MDERQVFQTEYLRDLRKPRVFAYCRISTSEDGQNLERQEKIIAEHYPNIPPCDVYRDVGTGNSFSEKYRPNWHKLLKRLIPGDTIVFSEVTRFSRNAEKGIEVYANLTKRKCNLVFIHADPAINNAELVSLLEYYDQTEEIVLDALRLELIKGEHENIYKAQRTVEGMQTASANGKQIGAPRGVRHVTKRELEMKPIIYQRNAETKRKVEQALEGLNTERLQMLPSMGGSYSDNVYIHLYRMSLKTLQKYRKEIVNDVVAFANGATPAQWMHSILR